MRRVAALFCMLALAACGGGGGGAPAPNPAPNPTPAPTPAPTPTAGSVAIVVDDGPAVLNTGPSPYTSADIAFVSVTVCVPGTSTCQTIDHLAVDTGSTGVRIFPNVLNASMVAALPQQLSVVGNPVGECFGFVDGYVFGSVRTADLSFGGQTASGMPIQLVADPALPSAIPASCSSGGGSNLDSVQAAGQNGVFGIGVELTDCGSDCAAGSAGAATYYDCPTTGCSAIITRAANTSAPFQQLVNPIGALPQDNNGVVISFPAVAASGAATVTGSLTFGVGTTSNNMLGSSRILSTTTSASPAGAGFLTVVYNGQTLTNGFLDTGSNGLYFVDGAITGCTAMGFTGYYCPAQTLTLSASFLAASGGQISAVFPLENAMALFMTPNAALPGIGANPQLLSNLMPFPNSFDFGLPFFFGRTVYLAFEGRTAAGTAGPYIAF